MKYTTFLFCTFLSVAFANALPQDETPCFFPCDRQANNAAGCASDEDWACICQSVAYQETLHTCLEGCPADRGPMLQAQQLNCNAAGVPVVAWP